MLLKHILSYLLLFQILPSMWKLRQHLLTHASSMPKRRYGAGPAADHGYATSQRQIQSHTSNHHGATPQKDASKDHPYATIDHASDQPVRYARQNLQNEPADTPPLSLVSSEHSYGTRLRNKGDGLNTEMMGGSNSRDRRYDHPYSAWENPLQANKSPSLPPPTPKKIKLKNTQNKRLSKNRSTIGTVKIRNKSKRVKILSNRPKRKQKIRHQNNKAEGDLIENKSSKLAAMDHQYASNKSSVDLESSVERKVENDTIDQVSVDPESHSNPPPTRSPSPPRGAAKRKASLNLQRARSRGSTTSNDANKQLRVQFEQQSKDQTIEAIHSIVDLSKYDPTGSTSGADPHLVVRLHPLKTVSSLQNPGTSAVANKLPIPALPNNRTRAGARKGILVETNFPCPQCEKTFPQRYRRARHIREVHDKEKRHQCGMCDKSFFKVTNKFYIKDEYQ